MAACSKLRRKKKGKCLHSINMAARGWLGLTDLSRPFFEFLHAVFIPNQLCIEFPDLDLDGIDPRFG
jgi:hypothetical protein